MTINKCMEVCAFLRPASFSEEQMASWLTEFEGRMVREVQGGESLLEYPRDGDVTLSVPAEYEEMYQLYLCAMMDFSLREYPSYNNTCVMLNSIIDKYKKQYLRENAPASRAFRNY